MGSDSPTIVDNGAGKTIDLGCGLRRFAQIGKREAVRP